VAERKRPGDDAAGDRPEDEAYTDSDLQDDAAEAADEPESRGGDKAESGSVATRREGRRGGNRISGFFREVVSELRKVIWPTRKELLTYTSVVIVFLLIMTAIVVGLDYLFAKGVLWTFGN
jgi:preprotein translocase subunit SecE